MIDRQHVWVGPEATRFEVPCEACLAKRGGVHRVEERRAARPYAVEAELAEARELRRPGGHPDGVFSHAAATRESWFGARSENFA